MLSVEQVWDLLGRWRAHELARACAYRECAGLSATQLEDIYHDAALKLYRQRFANERQLRYVLGVSIRRRALNVHRDASTHREILHANAPGIQVLEQARAQDENPESRLLASEDRLLVREFLAELSDEEYAAFCCVLDGHAGYRLVALRLGRPANEVRRALREAYRKCERFQVLYERGRLCGYRSQTIKALQEGRSDSCVLLERATAHLDHCSSCRAEHNTNSQRLHATFQRQAAAAILPLPVTGLVGRVAGLVHGLQARAGARTARQLAVHRLAALYTGEGAATKLARIATVAALAGGTATATHAITNAISNHHPHHRRVVHAHVNAKQPPAANATALLSAPVSQALTLPRRVKTPVVRRPKLPGRVIATGGPGHVVSERAYEEFANPASTRTTSAPRAPAPAVSRGEEHAYREFTDPASSRTASVPVRVLQTPPEEQRGGGLFSP
ncbi:MAG TPA: sigma-70 family RNA polymerase sigma factor [Solirubrobacteraceae bacterium]|nr:sigma-70 family RNA polymerase sigma factor [Solirubrobacteraceae bacterium]